MITRTTRTYALRGLLNGHRENGRRAPLDWLRP